jgi:hypothetical protein
LERAFIAALARERLRERPPQRRQPIGVEVFAAAHRGRLAGERGESPFIRRPREFHFGSGFSNGADRSDEPHRKGAPEREIRRQGGPRLCEAELHQAMPIAFAERRFKPLRRALIDRSVVLNRFEAQGAVRRQEAGERTEHRSGHIRSRRPQRLARLTKRPSIVVCDDQSSPTRRRFRHHAMASQTARPNHPTAQPDGDANSSIPSPTDRTNHPSAITALSARALSD